MSLFDEVAGFYREQRYITPVKCYEKTQEKFGLEVMNKECEKCNHHLSSHGFSSKECFHCKCEGFVEDNMYEEVKRIRDEEKS